MESFTFNGVNSSTLGLIIKEMPPIIRAAKSIESIKVNGRNDYVHIDNGTYEPYSITINCIIDDLTKLDQNKSVLQGVGDLQLSTVPDRKFKATIKNQISFSKYLRVLREFPLQLELEPISYGATLRGTETSESQTLIIGGNVETPPTITIYGTGTLTINNTPIEVLTSGITIDCKLMECTKDDLNMNAFVVLDEFPKLHPGNNTITLGTGVTYVSIMYHEGWL